MGITRKELEKIAKQLRAALAVIERELKPIEVPPDVQKMVEAKRIARICLAWNHEVPEGETLRRGLCETDYGTTMARIRRGEESEADLMARGLLGPKATGGRKSAREKAQPLEMTPEEAKQVAEDLETYLKKKGEK